MTGMRALGLPTFILLACVSSSIAQTTTPPQTPRQKAVPLALGARVSDSSGAPLPGVSVTATGPVARTGTTDEAGEVRFTNLKPGTYRLRFEGDKVIALEREVVLRPGQPVTVDVSLSPAPPPPPPPPAPKPEPPPPSRPAPVPPPEFRTFSIPDFVERNMIGREPSKTSVLACGASSTTSLVQIREPLKDRQHQNADELIYVVAGEGLLVLPTQEVPLEAGTFSLIPRGTPHTLQRRARQPLIMLSTMTDTTCDRIKP